MRIFDINAYYLAYITYRDVGVLGLKDYYFDSVEEALKTLRSIGCPSVIIQTCNRVEIYTYNLNPISALKMAGINRNFTAKAHIVRGVDVLKHLMRVICGLDSLAIGEHQVAGQVRKFYTLARSLKCVNPQLQQLFDEALRACKRVRESLPSSIMLDYISLTVNTISKYVKTGKILIIGTGDAAKEILEKLITKSKNYNIVIAGRHAEKVHKLASHYNVQGVLLKDVEKVVKNVDAIVTAISTVQEVITCDMISNVGSKPKVIIDLGVPPNVDSKIKELGIPLYTMEELSKILEDLRKSVKDYVKLAEKLIDEEVRKYIKKSRLKAVEDVISEMYRRAEEIRREELEEALNKLMPCVNHNRERVEEVLSSFSWSLIKKLYHHYVDSLRQLALNDKLDHETFNVILKLFNPSRR